MTAIAPEFITTPTNSHQRQASSPHVKTAEAWERVTPALARMWSQGYPGIIGQSAIIIAPASGTGGMGSQPDILVQAIGRDRHHVFAPGFAPVFVCTGLSLRVQRSQGFLVNCLEPLVQVAAQFSPSLRLLAR